MQMTCWCNKIVNTAFTFSGSFPRDENFHPALTSGPQEGVFHLLTASSRSAIFLTLCDVMRKCPDPSPWIKPTHSSELPPGDAPPPPTSLPPSSSAGEETSKPSAWCHWAGFHKSSQGFLRSQNCCSSKSITLSETCKGKKKHSLFIFKGIILMSLFCLYLNPVLSWHGQ